MCHTLEAAYKCQGVSLLPLPQSSQSGKIGEGAPEIMQKRAEHEPLRQENEGKLSKLLAFPEDHQYKVMYVKPTFFFRLLVLSLIMEEITSRVEFTNLKCMPVDKDIAEFDYCTLKAINRTYKYVSGKLKLYKIPITKVKVNFGLFKRFNGYKPFLYNQTIDACYFLNHQKSNPVAKYFYDIIRGITNVNHSCPYNHDIVVDRLSTEIVNHHLTKVLAYPDGDYMLESRWILNDIPSAVIQVYVSLS
ncbi:uncharacterized protein LOC119546175 [Drosophila subpulchrella]|uniref:uncharacterized protein LOC119546175 n=1 Tax=Drosophila subpulchrella TaxID=1486046 RepID=UPI0018A19B05|nr:uncharacterized protein LOC119546175 [Drosophila subpulchrella]